MSERCDVLVIGGGVIGAACAYCLAREGADVLVVDRGPVGGGSSWGNAGWIAPSHVTPLPAPGVIAQAIRWLGRSDAPFRAGLPLSWRTIRWLQRFAAFANERHLHRAAPVIAQLGLLSLDRHQRFAEEHGADETGFRQDGLLYVCRSEATLQGASRELELARRYGIAGRILSPAELADMFPGTVDAAGGVYYPVDAHAEPLGTVRALIDAARSHGARVWEGVAVRRFALRRSRVAAADTANGRVQAERLVLAAGSWTPLLACGLGSPLPIEPGRGYSLLLRRESSLACPTMLVDDRLALTPTAGGVRIAGMFDLCGYRESIPQARLESLVRDAARALAWSEAPSWSHIWCGLRPCTPDGLPIIGPVPGCLNTFIAAGHGTMGLALCHATGQLIAELCAGAAPSMDVAPLSPARFG